MATDSTVLERVRKLLALAGSPNVHEAASAAAMAQTLIERHRLERWLEAAESEAADPIEDGRDRPLEVARKIRKWKSALAATLADANGCVAYTLDRGREQAIVVAGRAADREAVVELWGWLHKRVEWLSATHGAGRSRQWHDAFRVGVVDAVGERLRKVAGEVRDEQQPGALARLDPTALVQREALERYVSEHLQLGRGRGIRVDARAWERGRAAGAELPLNK
ncbi:MAG: DUF2786 domain-containing protein [Myxococcota bacterium]